MRQLFVEDEVSSPLKATITAVVKKLRRLQLLPKNCCRSCLREAAVTVTSLRRSISSYPLEAAVSAALCNSCCQPVILKAAEIHEILELLRGKVGPAEADISRI